MKTFSATLVAAFAAVAQAVQLTNSDFAITAGQPFTITWSGATGAVTINLKNGASTDLKTVAAITTGATGNSFTWTPSASLPADTYAIEITDGSETNYSGQFQISGASGAATATGVSSTTGATTSPTTVPGSDSVRLGSPIALIGLTVAAMLYFQ
ncbi:hypothetical protein K4K59_000469 [Colletotrichum sp. SAR11_240]|nr:hypothetical protein K4K59_000469 [Colletotrichum sp. SAR11_240]